MALGRSDLGDGGRGALDRHDAGSDAGAGIGGDGPCAMGPEGNEECMGQSGGVTKISADGSQERVLDGLATNQGCPGSSTISTRRPSGDCPEMSMPFCSSAER